MAMQIRLGMVACETANEGARKPSNSLPHSPDFFVRVSSTTGRRRPPQVHFSKGSQREKRRSIQCLNGLPTGPEGSLY